MNQIKTPFINVDLAVCDLILRNPELLNKFNDCAAGKFLKGEGKEVYDFIYEHYLSYGVVPSKETVFSTIKKDWDMQAPEPLEFYIKQIQKREALLVLSKGIKDSMNSVNVRDTEKAIDQLRDAIIVTEKICASDKKRDLDYKETALDRLAEFEEAIEQKGIVGLPFPWSSLNEFTGGLAKQDLALIVAGTAKCKTWIMTAVAAYMAAKGERVLYISKEMSPNVINKRIDALCVEMSFDGIRRGTLDDMGQKDRYREYLRGLGDTDINVKVLSSVSAKNPQDINFRVREYAPTVLFIDGVYIIQGTNLQSARHAQREQVVEELKLIAAEYDIPIMGTVQFKQTVAGEKASEKLRGGIADIGGSHSFSMWCDTMLGVYRNKELEKNNKLVMRMLKNRHGNPGTDISLSADFENMRFTELEQNQSIPVGPQRGGGTGFIF